MKYKIIGEAKVIPDFQTVMLPLLKLLANRQEIHYQELVEKISNEFSLTEQERLEPIPSGRQPLIYNRIGWAKSYLKKAGLLTAPSRGTARITDLGISVLNQNPEKINLRFLSQFVDFREFKETKNAEKEQDSIFEQKNQTPEEILEEGYQEIRDALSSELLEKIITLSPAFFERLVVDLLVRMGYGGSVLDAGKAIGRSGDEGIDGIIKEDKLGLDMIYIQAKRWNRNNTIGRPELQKFVGALAGQGARKGIFITTSTFTKEALDYTPKNDTKIVLIDGIHLSELMIDHNLGCSIQQTFEIKKIDTDYFEEY